MVTFIHSSKDQEAGYDLTRIYNTRTLDTVQCVTPTNVKLVLASILTKGCMVVVPAEEKRMTDTLLSLLRCLKIMGVTVWHVEDYLKQLKQTTASAGAPVHAKPSPTGAVERLAAPAG